MSKPCLIFLLALVVVPGASACRGTAPDPGTVPVNFVVILADDLGVMDLGSYNPESFYETPNLDRLARSGMRFTDAYAPSPVCSPTRYGIQTGRYPTRAAATNFFVGNRAGRFRPAEMSDRMPLADVTVAEALKDRGYSTFYAGKWHLGPTPEFWPEHQGYDVNRGGHSAGGPYGPGKYFTPYGNPRLEDGPPGEHLPDRLAAETAAFIAENRNRPFLAFLAFYSVHTPLQGRPDLVEKYERKRRAQGLDGVEEFADEEQVWPVEEPRKVRIVQSHAVYGAMVEAMDQAVGKVLDSLESAGIADRTFVIFTSDNGGLSTAEGSPTSNLPFRAGKGWLYEGGIREPLIIAGPGVRQSSTDPTPVVAIDLFPTILDLAGFPGTPSPQVDGRSLAPLVRGTGGIDRPAIYWHYPHYSNQGGFPGGGVRMGDWKLLERFEDGQVHLFNLREDPGERSDLAPTEVEKVSEMRRDLHRWYKEVNARFLEPPAGEVIQPWRPE